MRFNPPPNWPPAPAGFTPDASWQPDPAWGPPPPGWPVWVDDTAAVPADYRPAGSTGVPKSRKPLWLLLAALATAIALAGVALLVVSGRTSDTAHSTKPDIGALAADLLVDQSEFPQLSEDATWGDWQEDADSGEFGPPDDITVDPPDCADLVDAPRSTTATVGGKLSDFTVDHLRSYAMQLAVTSDQVPFAALVDTCKTFTITSLSHHGDDADEMTATVRPLAVSGLPGWAVAYTISIEPAGDSGEHEEHDDAAMAMALIAGYYRGVLVQANYSDNVDDSDPGSFGTDAADELLKLFNAQVAKLEAAP